jgi:FlaA1/EpsC-like NDP-sugar epimerase
VFTGLRPGEKLYEELLFAKEQTLPTRHERIRIASVAHDGPPVAQRFLGWLAESPVREDAAVRAFLADLITEYQPDARFAAPFDDTFVDAQTRPLRVDAL